MKISDVTSVNNDLDLMNAMVPLKVPPVSHVTNARTDTKKSCDTSK